METKTLTVVSRTGTGKGAARKTRKEGNIPAVIYGHHDPVSISINARDFNSKFHSMSENTIITLEGLDKPFDVLIKDYQDDILTGKLVHIDFFEIERGKTLRTHVPVHTTGNSKGVRLGGTLEVLLHDLEIECLPKDLPQEILIDISDLDINDSVHIDTIIPPPGVKFLSSGDTTVLLIAALRKEEPTAASEEEAEIEASEEPAAE